MDESEFEQLQKNIEASQKIVDLGKSLDRLLNNKDFKRVITEEFLQNEAIRLVSLKADYEMQTPEKQASILKQIDAIGHFNEFLNGLQRRVSMARISLAADEETRDEVLKEGK